MLPTGQCKSWTSIHHHLLLLQTPLQSLRVGSEWSWQEKPPTDSDVPFNMSRIEPKHSNWSGHQFQHGRGHQYIVLLYHLNSPNIHVPPRTAQRIVTAAVSATRPPALHALPRLPCPVEDHLPSWLRHLAPARNGWTWSRLKVTLPGENREILLVFLHGNCGVHPKGY